jgi:regulator of sigma E protease
VLSAIPDFIRSAAAFVVVLGVLVFVHEFGHYLAARWRGVRVETFSIGFGKAIASWTDSHGTIWKLAWLPLGGYVKMHGQERAQLVNDRIVAIGDQPIATFEDLQHTITAHPAETLAMTVQRDGSNREIEVTTDVRESGGRKIGLLGVRGGAVEYRHVSLPAAIWGGVTQTWVITAETFNGLAEMIGGRRGTDDLGGPLRIAQLSGQIAQLGAASLISFIAVLSVNLGLINLFPIPVLDGGHLLFYAAEALCGRPLPQRAQEYGFRAGLALIACLFVFATWNDLTHLGLFRWVAGLIG